MVNIYIYICPSHGFLPWVCKITLWWRREVIILKVDLDSIGKKGGKTLAMVARKKINPIYTYIYTLKKVGMKIGYIIRCIWQFEKNAPFFGMVFVSKKRDPNSRDGQVTQTTRDFVKTGRNNIPNVWRVINIPMLNHLVWSHLSN